MHFSISYHSLILAAYLGVFQATALPATPVEPCGSPGQDVKYAVSSTTTNQLGKPVVGDYSCVGTSSCNFQDGNEFSVTVQVEVGVDLSLDFEDISGDAGVSTSVSVATESGTTQSVSASCPVGPWTCALIIWPPVTVVSGTQTPLYTNCKPAGAAAPYTVEFPEKMSNGQLVGGRVDVCACMNFKYWANEGAPSIQCPQDCVA
ncbi:hypothetical protein IMSHALPRED_005832 [Imshaugia aleurites]|uniref:Uncharacterized protein n=1 Tax=Imshaugia aleurites TaxID=172621 RepID=A0A8H3FHT8_9LECA|nr:hypothetical protein IMSHALPRED_005832 [Imshaugia aleurites]